MSTSRIVICPERSNEQNSMPTLSTDGNTLWISIERMNCICNRLFVDLADSHLISRRRAKHAPASLKLWVIATRWHAPGM